MKSPAKKPPKIKLVTAYVRSGDEANMVEVAPHQYVSEHCLIAMGMAR